MGVGLQPLEFSECLADSPAFRDNLQRHEKELERTSQQIKRLIKEVKDVVQAARRLGAAQLALASSMEQFEFACIGASQTEDERVIGRSLRTFAALIRTVEDERDRMLGRAHEQIIQPLERFRKEHIGAVKEGKKKFEKKTAKFSHTQERTLALSLKKPDAVFQEADAALDMAERDFCAASLEYVFQLQAVQERKKFELVETLLGFVFGWWTFHHTAHDVHADAEPRVRDLQLRIQRTRTNFEETSKQTESLMKKMMEMRQLSKEEEGGAGGEDAARAGYLFLHEKKAFGTTWSKQYAVWRGRARSLALTPATGAAGGEGGAGAGAGDAVLLAGARPALEPPDRRFCWEALPVDRERPPLLLQALSERDKSQWLRAINGSGGGEAGGGGGGAAGAGGGEGEEGTDLDAAGFDFVRAIIHEVEARGLDEQGLYRVAGVASKTAKLVSGWRGGARAVRGGEWDTRTLTSALKAFLRALPDRLLPARLACPLLAAAKLERRSERVAAVATLMRRLPPAHSAMLRLLLPHLRRVAARASENRMSASNLAVCWGPTLLRADTDSVASILDLKFCNVLVETLLEHYQEIFETPTVEAVPSAAPASHNGLPPARASAGVGAPFAGGVRSDLPMPLTCGAGATTARYSPQHQQLLAQMAGGGPHRALPRAPASTSSSESVSDCSASPPRAPAPAPAPARARTLYACLGESEGELSFEPNQILTDVAPSPEPGWLRATLNGRAGLVPENYVEPLP